MDISSSSQSSEENLEQLLVTSSEFNWYFFKNKTNFISIWWTIV